MFCPNVYDVVLIVFLLPFKHFSTYKSGSSQNVFRNLRGEVKMSSLSIVGQGSSQEDHTKIRSQVRKFNERSGV